MRQDTDRSKSVPKIRGELMKGQLPTVVENVHEEEEQQMKLMKRLSKLERRGISPCAIAKKYMDIIQK